MRACSDQNQHLVINWSHSEKQKDLGMGWGWDRRFSGRLWVLTPDSVSGWQGMLDCGFCGARQLPLVQQLRAWSFQGVGQLTLSPPWDGQHHPSPVLLHSPGITHVDSNVLCYGWSMEMLPYFSSLYLHCLQNPKSACENRTPKFKTKQPKPLGSICFIIYEIWDFELLSGTESAVKCWTRC